MKRFYPWIVLVLACAVLGGRAAGQQKNPPAKSTIGPDNPAADPLFDVPPLPTSKISLVGGRVAKIDRVRNRLTVQVYGGGKMEMSFDERSHIYRDGVETTQLGIRKGDRVYVDTQLDGTKVFARNIRVDTTTTPADARGQIVAFDARTGTMQLRDDLSSEEVNFQVNPETGIQHAGKAATLADLKPGTLVAVRFSPEEAKGGLAREISILAMPGSSFVFAGKVTYLDLHLGTFAVNNGTDQKTYELHFDPASTPAADQLVVGAEVTVRAVFDGTRYVASHITVKQ